MKSALPNPKFFFHWLRWRHINHFWQTLQTSIKHLPNYPIFLGKKLKTRSKEPTEHFSRYFGYTRPLFRRWVSLFKLFSFFFCHGNLTFFYAIDGGKLVGAPLSPNKTDDWILKWCTISIYRFTILKLRVVGAQEDYNVDATLSTNNTGQQNLTFVTDPRQNGLFLG